MRTQTACSQHIHGQTYTHTLASHFMLCNRQARDKLKRKRIRKLISDAITA